MAKPHSHRDILVSFLRRHGITDSKQVEEIVGGFDLRQPVYERRLEEGERLCQFIRNPSAGSLSPQLGNWFSLAGATMDGVGIFSGGAGRTRHTFKVVRTVWCVEGTAASLARNWSWAGGGTGGATQIFLPKDALFALEGEGQADSHRR